MRISNVCVSCMATLVMARYEAGISHLSLRVVMTLRAFGYSIFFLADVMYRSSILPLCGAFCAIVSASGQSGVPYGVTTLPHDFANISVTFAQAPLLSIVPWIGQKLELLGLFHTALVLHQEAYEDHAEQYWTLELDLGGAGGFPNGILPMLHENVFGSTFEWDHPARWFFREGLLYNRSHWTKNFDTVATITPAHFQSLFDDLVMPMNSTNHTQFPQYALLLSFFFSLSLSFLLCLSHSRYFSHLSFPLSFALC